MSEKLEKSVFNSTNLLWGCGALGGLAGMYFMWNRKFRSAHQEYTEEQVRDALRDFHKEFYPVYCMISGDINRMNQSIKQQIGLQQHQKLPDDMKAEVKQVFLAQSAWIKEDIAKIEAAVMRKHKMESHSYELMVINKHKASSSIVNKRKEIDEAFDKAFDGILPAMDPTICKENFTAENVLEVYRDTIIWQLNFIVGEAIKIKQSGGNCTETNVDWIMALNKLGQETVSIQF